MPLLPANARAARLRFRIKSSEKSVCQFDELFAIFSELHSPSEIDTEIELVTDHTASDSSRTAIEIIADGLTESVLWGVGIALPSIARSNMKRFNCGVDHVTVCVPSVNMANTLRSLQESEGISEGSGSGLMHMSRGVAVGSVVFDACTVSIVSPIERIPHLEAFLLRYPSGAVQHFAVSVPSMREALSRVRARGIPTLQDLLRAKGRSRTLPLSMGGVLTEGFVEELCAGGHLRQTFVFPEREAIGPFIEIVERASVSGYGSENPRVLFEALDCICE